MAPLPRDHEADRVRAQITAADLYRDRIERALDAVVGKGRYAVTVSVEFDDVTTHKRTTLPPDTATLRKEKHERYNGSGPAYTQDSLETRTPLPAVEAFQSTAFGRVKDIRCCVALTEDCNKAESIRICELAKGALGERSTVTVVPFAMPPPPLPLPLGPAWILVSALAFLLGGRRLARLRARGIVD